MNPEAPLRVLLVEDNPGDALLVKESLQAGWGAMEVQEAGTLADALAALSDGGFDVVLLDLTLPDARGVESVDQVAPVAGDAPVVVLTGMDDEDTALKALQAGAQDYLVKGLNQAPQIRRALRYAMERRRAQERIRVQARLLDAVGQAVIAQRPDGTITWWGEGARRLFGWTAEEAVGRRFEDLLLPDDGPARDTRARDREKLREGSGFRREMALLHRDGDMVVVDSVVSPLPSVHGEVTGMVEVATDVSDRRAAEAALRESERRFRALIEDASDAVMVLGRDGRARYASPTARDFLMGVPEEGPMSWGGAVHPDDIGGLREAWASVLERESDDDPVGVEVRAVGPGDGWRYLEVRLRNLLAVEGVEGVVVHARDVSDRRDLEQRLRESQRMEAVGRLAGGIAHDFNNIVTGMQGFARLALDESPPDASWREDLEELERLGERAAALTRQLLAFSRKQVLQPRILDLNRIVEATGRMLSRLIGEDVRVRFDLADGPCHVAVDPAQMEQVVVNLAMNARDAMPDGGDLVLSTGRRTLDEEAAGDVGLDRGAGVYAFLCVADTGGGMDARVRKLAFEPFFTTKPTGKGTGLGLSTVFGIVKQSGGGVILTSDPGRGTEVTIYLPLAPRDEDGPDWEEGRAGGGGPSAVGDAANGDGGDPAAILVVEDDDAVRDIVERILVRSGWIVVAVGGGRAALGAVRRGDRRFALVVSDLNMPGMSGRELARSVAELAPGVPFLFMSGDVGSPSGEGLKREAGAWYLQKPFSAVQLGDAVLRVLREAEGRESGRA